jgi:hypothetical protein
VGGIQRFRHLAPRDGVGGSQAVVAVADGGGDDELAAAFQVQGAVELPADAQIRNGHATRGHRDAPAVGAARRVVPLKSHTDGIVAGIDDPRFGGVTIRHLDPGDQTGAHGPAEHADTVHSAEHAPGEPLGQEKAQHLPPRHPGLHPALGGLAKTQQPLRLISPLPAGRPVQVSGRSHDLTVVPIRQEGRLDGLAARVDESVALGAASRLIVQPREVPQGVDLPRLEVVDLGPARMGQTFKGRELEFLLALPQHDVHGQHVGQVGDRRAHRQVVRGAADGIGGRNHRLDLNRPGRTDLEIQAVLVPSHSRRRSRIRSARWNSVPPPAVWCRPSRCRCIRCRRDGWRHCGATCRIISSNIPIR